MADQKKVVFEYIEALLIEEEQMPRSEPEEVCDPYADDWAAVAQEEVASSASEPEPEPEPVASVAAAPVSPPPAAARPGRVLNCVLLDMHGLKLAIPFDQIEGALQFNDLSMTLAGLPDWVLGAFGDPAEQTQVVDTAHWLIPERYQAEHSQYSEVVILHGRRWGLACDGLVKSVQIPEAEINWNQDKAQRSWLLGTYMPERCALLDIPQLVDEFEAMSA